MGSNYHNGDVSYNNTIYTAESGVHLSELSLGEDWEGRPASDWSVQRIGVLQSKIERYTYQIYHSSRYGKHNLSKLIPRHILVQYANESFGFDGWRTDIEFIEIRDGFPISTSSVNITNDMKEDEQLNHDNNEMVTVIAEASVKVTLKDGTNTRMPGFSRATTKSKAESFNKAKKEAVNDALKKALLSFEKIIIEHDIKVENNFYVDGLYGSKVQ
ncbi:DNA repair protein RAD59 [Nakaseomyces bracarensis]|uniref:DNA repair protein RAD59 n=1 Tax=Nakaseomyces bracarensis TaxID=273131 RepID=A0ABR4NNK2_9SACH